LLAAAAALLALVAFALASCGGGGGTTPNPNGVRPTITSISPNSANPGDRLVITGLNFGDTQGASSVTLNGVTFTIVSWSDTEIDVTVPTGVSSGIIAVIVNGLESQSASQAQLFIGAAPGGAAILNTLNPNFGRVGTDSVTLVGENFGTADNGKVFFAAAGNTTVQANIVPNAGGTGVQWSSTSIVAYVPATAVSGNVYVQAGSSVSNSLSFTALPAPDGLNPPTIDSVTSNDANIGVGSIVSIAGSNFGNQQGGSTITIGGLTMSVVNWSNTRIDAHIPAGATTGPITINVGGSSVISQPVTIGNKPVITGVSPSQIHVSGTLDVYGQFFGTTQGTGTLSIGSKVVTVDTWDDTHIHVAKVPALTAGPGGSLTVTVTASDGLASDPFAASLYSNIKAAITVQPSAGVAGNTTFNFYVQPSGGSGDYSFALIPDKNQLTNSQPSTSTSPVGYQYPPSALGAAKQKTFNTAFIITDNSTQESVTVDGPSVLVVGPTQPVVTQISVDGDTNFNRNGVLAPNDWCYYLDGPDYKYNAFTFYQQVASFASYLNVTVDQSSGNPVPTFVRDESSYMTGGSMPRALAYRYNTSLGNEPAESSEVRLDGLNFGATMGSITLAVGSPGESVLNDATTIDEWTDKYIRFHLPDGAQVNLSGKITVTTASNDTFTSQNNLTCSAYFTGVTPPANVDPAGLVDISGFDFFPPAQAGEIGNKTYLFWIINAKFTNPYTMAQDTAQVPVVTPLEPQSMTSNDIIFDMSKLSDVDVEVFNATQSDSQIAHHAQLVGGSTDLVFLWTGAIEPFSDNGKIVANSGVFSQAIPVNVGMGGGGGGGGLTVTFDANPTTTSASLGPDVQFTWTVSGGTAPYTVDLDFGDSSPHHSDTAGGSVAHTYGTATGPGGLTATLHVTDSASGSSTQTKTIVVSP
jgi:hypothetical protein